MLPYRDSKITRIALIIFFIILAMYAYFEARGLLFGPMIQIGGQPQTVRTPYVLIAGHADRIASLSVDGAQIEVTVNGDFQEPYVLAPGVNRIVFDAKDSYGHTTEKILEIVYTPPATSTPSTSASSTAAATDSTSSPQATP